MKFILLLAVLTIAAAIRVPASWDGIKLKEISNNNHRGKPNRLAYTSERIPLKNKYFSYGVSKRHNNRPYSRFVNNRKNNVHNYYKPKHNVNTFKSNDWIPMLPKNYSNEKKKKFYNKEAPKQKYDEIHKPLSYQSDNEEPYEIEKVADFEDGDYLEDAKTRQYHSDKIYQNTKKNQHPHKSEEKEYYHDDNDSEDETFVPSRLYTKVRRSDSYDHLPYDENERLRKVIKESKIHTIYTEKGYEDSGYDHADQEKNSENGQSFSKHKIENAPTNGYDKTTQNHVQNEPNYDEPDTVIDSSQAILHKENFSMEHNNGENIEDNPKNHHEETVQIDVSHKPEHKDAVDINTESINKTIRIANSQTSDKRKKRSAENSILPNKYPYYNDKNVNDNSPLRYSENLDNIPLKTEDSMAFYNKANNIMNCSEQLPTDDITEFNKTVGNMTVVVPREVSKKGNLGDQIDCFKDLYFGSNPLDSPLFTEENIGPISDDFLKEFSISNKFTKSVSEHYDDLNNEIVPYTNSTTQSINDEIIQSDSSINKLNFNILTDIIGQIKDKNSNETQLLDPSDNLTNTTDIAYESDREGRILVDENDNSTDSNTPESQALIFRRRKFRPSRPYHNKFYDYNKGVPRKTTATYHPYFEEYVPTSTVLPKYKVVSEVFYKDEIKPNEQLNVFADIINNIKNSSRINDDSGTDYSEPIAVKLNVDSYRKSSTKKIKVPSKRIRIKNVLEDSYLDTYGELQNMNKYTSTSTMKPIVAYKQRPKFNTHRNNEQVYEELLQSIKNRDQNTDESQNKEQFTENALIHKVKLRRRNRKNATTTTASPEIAEDENFEDSTKTVMGLIPPGQFHYKTIVGNKEVEDTFLNKYIVPGMKPPPKQKVISYSSYRLSPKNKVKRRQDIHYRRNRREANKPAYSEYSRNRGRQEENLDKIDSVNEDDDDDYVPHRPKNYHYDEKLGKIVYHNEQKSQDEDDEEIYEEIIETTRAPKPKSTRKPLVITSPKPGESFMDYVQLLKSNTKYQMIIDSTTTEKPTTTIKPIKVSSSSKDPPEFLNLLSKLHNNSKYKPVENEKEATSKQSEQKRNKDIENNAKIVEEEEEEEEEDIPANVQNSPGGQNVHSDPNYQIFDIGEFIPKVKNYLPRTSIDYSKYKTIERPNTRHNLSARYNSEEESLEEVNTSRLPILSEKTVTISERADLSEKSTENIEKRTTIEPPTTTTAEPPTKAPKLRVRGRKRPTTTTIPSITKRITYTTTSTTERVQHDKPKRNYLRRRPTRIKLKTTTEKFIDEEIDDTTKILRRRSEQSTATELTNFQPIYVPDEMQEEINEDDALINVENVTESSPKVEVFKKYDPRKKHGGNYRRIDDSPKTENEQDIDQSKLYKVKIVNGKKVTQTEKPTERLADVVPKPFAFYTDPILPKSINHLKTVEDEGQVEDETSTEENFDYYEDEVQINFEKKADQASVKKPNIIKDPSKRLYYYTPL